MPSDQLLTFFRRGKLKRFVRADDIESTEVTFLEAAKQFACEPDAERQPIPEHYYGYLDSAKQHLAALEQEDPTEPQRRGSSNADHILKAVKATLRHTKRLTDDDEDFLRKVRVALEAGIIPKNRLKVIKDELKQNFAPLKLLALLKRQIGEQELTPPQRSDRERKPTEIILSAYLHRSEP